MLVGSLYSLLTKDCDLNVLKHYVQLECKGDLWGVMQLLAIVNT